METEEGLNRTIAVGDIHGCSIAFNALLEAVRLHTNDTLVILGDFIDRGPDSRGVLERLIELQDRCRLVPLLGNHEEMFLEARDGKSRPMFWKDVGGQEMLESYDGLDDCQDIPREHIDLIKNCQIFFETDTHIFVHAGVAPNLPMEHQSATDMLWRPLEPAEEAPHFSGKTAVVGHTPQPDGQVLDLGFLKCIDTLCHAGGWLAALDVQSGKVWQSNQQGEIRESSLRTYVSEQEPECN